MAQIRKNGAPDKNTVGNVGDTCINNITGNKYILESVINISSYEKQFCYYVWKRSGSSGETSSTLIDTVTGDSYELEVTNGKLVLKEA